MAENGENVGSHQFVVKKDLICATNSLPDPLMHYLWSGCGLKRSRQILVFHGLTRALQLMISFHLFLFPELFSKFCASLRDSQNCISPFRELLRLQSLENALPTNACWLGAHSSSNRTRHDMAPTLAERLNIYAQFWKK